MAAGREAAGPRYGMRVDLHVHTTVSDGLHLPAAVFGMAARSRIAVLAITDHDAIDGYLALAAAAAAGGGPTLLCGAEISSSAGTEEAHILGYFPAGPPPELRSFLQGIQEERRERLGEACGRLRAAGLSIESRDVALEVRGPVVTRSHYAQALVRLGRVTSLREAYARFLGEQTGLIPLPHHDAAAVVSRIAGWGGVAVWAHPRLDALEGRLDDLVRVGLAGIEAYHPSFGREETRRILEVAAARHLLITAGSDWHGYPRQGALTGVSIGVDRIGPFLDRVGLGSGRR